MKTMLQAALYYLEKLNFSIIPIDKEKVALIKWTLYQERKPTKEEVVSWWDKWPDANIGIITGKISNLIVFDLDLYKVNKDQQAKIEGLTPYTAEIPLVRTPRGGLHKYYRYPDIAEVVSGFSGKKGTELDGLDLRAEGNYAVAPPSQNGTGKPYEWVNKQALLNIGSFNPIAFKSLINTYNTIIYSNTDANNTSVTDRYLCYNDGYRGESLFTVVNSLAKGGMKKIDAGYILELTAEKCEPPYDKEKLKTILDSAYDRKGKREKGVEAEVADFVSVTNGYYSVTECALALPALQRGSIRQAMARLVEKGVIERDPKVDGRYRRIEKDIEETDWMNATVEEIPIRYPFNIQKLFITMPKNIIVVSGTSDAGKTSFLLNFVNKNMNTFKNKIHYFSSEMGAMEFKSRVEKFGFDLRLWEGRFKFYERSGDFSDVIKPDEINIIDYLDITDEFYKIGLYIKQIFDKLNKGIALIALQKNPDKEHGLGGMRSVEKARLYVSIDPGRMKIVKCKNWKTKVNPNGLYINFKTVDGCKIMPDVRGWQKDVKDDKTAYIEEEDNA